MSPFLWLQRLFVPPSENGDPENAADLENTEPFVFSQHLRVVLAILVCIISAFVIWWIMV